MHTLFAIPKIDLVRLDGSFCNPWFALIFFIAFVEALAARVCLTIQIVFLSLFLNSTHVFPRFFASVQGPSRDRRAPD
jgi:hypothetical protein